MNAFEKLREMEQLIELWPSSKKKHSKLVRFVLTQILREFVNLGSETPKACCYCIVKTSRRES